MVYCQWHCDFPESKTTLISLSLGTVCTLDYKKCEELITNTDKVILFLWIIRGYTYHYMVGNCKIKK